MNSNHRMSLSEYITDSLTPQFLPRLSQAASRAEVGLVGCGSDSVATSSRPRWI